MLVDGFEKNEILYGFHWRELPCTDEAEANHLFERFAGEAGRWKGPAVRASDDHQRAWDDLEIRQAGRGVIGRVRAPWFSGWWHEASTWKDDPMTAVHEWIRDEAAELERSAR